MNKNFKHWNLRRDEDGIAWLCFDKADASTNVLSRDVMIELNDQLEALEKKLPKAVVIHSGKKSGFHRRRRHQGVHRAQGRRRSLRDGALAASDVLSTASRACGLPHDRAASTASRIGGGLELALACDATAWQQTLTRRP
jgi:3-hydroxyacyl-CoA dehydrogenase / enoyl-CoA hydratase / 3-hydroxybutyryl-CoA epimerase